MSLCIYILDFLNKLDINDIQKFFLHILLVFVFNSLDQMVAAYSVGLNLDGSKIICGFNKCIRVFHTSRPGRYFDKIDAKGEWLRKDCVIFYPVSPSPLYTILSRSREFHFSYIFFFLEFFRYILYCIYFQLLISQRWHVVLSLT